MILGTGALNGDYLNHRAINAGAFVLGDAKGASALGLAAAGRPVRVAVSAGASRLQLDGALRADRGTPAAGASVLELDAALNPVVGVVMAGASGLEIDAAARPTRQTNGAGASVIEVDAGAKARYRLLHREPPSRSWAMPAQPRTYVMPPEPPAPAPEDREADEMPRHRRRA